MLASGSPRANYGILLISRVSRKDELGLGSGEPLRRWTVNVPNEAARDWIPGRGAGRSGNVEKLQESISRSEVIRGSGVCRGKALSR